IFEFKGGDSFIRRFEARTGTLGDGVFKLEKARLLESGKAEKNYEKLNLPTTLTLGKIQENFSSPDTLSFWELPEFIKFFESAGFSAYKHRLHWHALLVSPFLLCAMVLVAAVFSLKPNQRQGGLLIRIVGGVGAGFLLFFFTKVIFALGLSAALPIALAAWSPVVICSLLSLAFLLHKEDG
ncbi:MAG: LptF/LptG family permease, partial [Alphaproteobacteria bacterium]|nr:LptF/LptG family permease [Alphaproteobacteria bacterium]